jgi:hypothetical protein
MANHVWTNIEADDCTFTIECLPEDIAIRGNVLVSGDVAEDKQAEDEIIRQLKSGNDWAWCTVKVTARVEFDFFGVDYLGCCSYMSEDDFKKGGYYEDMKANALNDLNKQGQELCKKLNKRATDHAEIVNVSCVE